MTEASTTIDTAFARRQPVACVGLREAFQASGPDTVDFLQGQLSQDVASMAPGDAGFTLLLHPQGKIAAWMRVARVADDTFVFDVDAGHIDEAIARLERFKLRTDCTFTKLDWQSITVVGPGARSVAVTGAEHDVDDSFAGLEARVAFGPDVAVGGDITTVGPELIDSLRVEAGRPAMGTELDESTIPAAAGIVEQSVSFTKGCYTGQELVARIDSRGNNVPRRLVGLVVEGALAGAPVEVSVDGASVGHVTTVGASADLGVVALGYVGRNVEVGASVVVGDTTAVVHQLPLVRG